MKLFLKENSYFHASLVSRDIYETYKPIIHNIRKLKEKSLKKYVLRYRTVPSEIILPKCDFLASNCQPTDLEGYLVKCIPIFTFACKKVGIDLLLSYSELG